MSTHPPHGSLPANWQSPHSMVTPHRYSLGCDADGCSATSPETDAIDFDIGGEKMARAIAEHNGWVRVRVDGRMQDLCPAHKPAWATANDSRARGSR